MSASGSTTPPRELNPELVKSALPLRALAVLRDLDAITEESRVL